MPVASITNLVVARETGQTGQMSNIYYRHGKVVPIFILKVFAEIYFIKNIVSLKVIIIIKFYIDIYEKSALEQFFHIFLLIDHCLLSIVQGVPNNVFFCFFLGVMWRGVYSNLNIHEWQMQLQSFEGAGPGGFGGLAADITSSVGDAGGGVLCGEETTGAEASTGKGDSASTAFSARSKASSSSS